MKILVIDDADVQRMMMCRIIKNGKFKGEILQAKNGDEAIELLGRNSQEVCLILCDWNMPGLSGIDFAEGVAKVPALAKIPFFMVSAEGTQDKMDEAKAKHPNITGYIPKPFTPDRFLSYIDKYFD